VFCFSLFFVASPFFYGKLSVQSSWRVDNPSAFPQLLSPIDEKKTSRISSGHRRSLVPSHSVCKNKHSIRIRARLDSRVLSILAHFCPFFRESTTSELYGVWIQNGPIFGNGRSHTTVRQKNKYLPRYLFYFRTLQRHGTTTQPKNKIQLTPANLNHSDTVTTHHPPLSPQPPPPATPRGCSTAIEASHIRVTQYKGSG
jgi:hypothetical protein